MQLYVVRHGETQANAEGRYQGSLDVELNERGVLQAQELRVKLPVQIDTVVVSPLRRAQQTAAIVFADDGLALSTLDAFRERGVGVFEGLTQEEAAQRYPELWAQNITRQWELAPTDGESISQFVERIRGGLNELLLNHGQQVVVLVAHGVVAKAIRALVRDDFSDFFDWQLRNGEVLTLKIDSTSVVRGLVPRWAAQRPQN
ncbi:histidine phosphatase family protein [Pseudomonas sp. TH32]|uniref:histidine phosphatase family protein n=1 Tax=unclassified Pseudomonas TaxID=196821 RepID=UPI0019125863|nr:MULTISPECIES: histidine phosphatase family protein [unclassified Pseudomonas]MBK5438232.1 histidine phosphatase family protein [Pseudomonas sp. TH32]MDF3198623.1 histidine phosphatase family protein [Pseudomonas sp. 1912-s]